MSWDVEIAKEFKNRDNKSNFGATIGQIISINPLKVSIYNNRVILNDKNIYKCSKLQVNANDKVLCLPTENGQKFFIVDKVV